MMHASPSAMARLAGAGTPTTSTGRAAGPLARGAHLGTAAASTTRRAECRATSGRGTSSSTSASDAASRVAASTRRCARRGFLSSGKISREPGPARSWPSIDRAALSSRGAWGSSRSREGDDGLSSSRVATRSVSDPTVVTQSPESSSDEETDDDAGRAKRTDASGRTVRADRIDRTPRLDPGASRRSPRPLALAWDGRGTASAGPVASVAGIGRSTSARNSSRGRGRGWDSRGARTRDRTATRSPARR
jgi:hypothetical protein